ncbi:hypothetical protein CM19_04910 [Candidatus Acidianus copahuensis]|uniref:DUF309 domain-containing protein n=2 Tax=Acidianus TaxID=12914 RepID=A0A031LNS9_9CREN|nr:DUF309 domain-containing protein [Candidatus Acidianus copahuensis]EZQ06742.1 hypothetical protein CM19_04910 [Candidatus Acidianus copahuensis]
MERKIYFYDKEKYFPLIKQFLRERGINVIDVRLCKYMEVDAEGNVEDILGKANFIVDTKNLEEGNFFYLFSEGRFWEAHESLEKIWRTKDGKEKDFQQSLILIATAMLKYCKGEKDIAFKLIMNAREILGKTTNNELLEFLKNIIVQK